MSDPSLPSSTPSDPPVASLSSEKGDVDVVPVTPSIETPAAGVQPPPATAGPATEAAPPPSRLVNLINTASDGSIQRMLLWFIQRRVPESQQEVLKSRVTELAKSSSLRVVVGKLLTQAKLTDEDVTRMVSDAGVHSAASADYRKMMISVLHGCLHVAQCPAGCQHPNCNSVRNAYKHVQECEHGNTCPDKAAHKVKAYGVHIETCSKGQKPCELCAQAMEEHKKCLICSSKTKEQLTQLVAKLQQVKRTYDQLLAHFGVPAHHVQVKTVSDAVTELEVKLKALQDLIAMPDDAYATATAEVRHQWQTSQQLAVSTFRLMAEAKAALTLDQTRGAMPMRPALPPTTPTASAAASRAMGSNASQAHGAVKGRPSATTPKASGGAVDPPATCYVSQGGIVKMNARQLYTPLATPDDLQGLQSVTAQVHNGIDWLIALPRLRVPNAHEVGLLKVPPLAPRLELTLDDIIGKFGRTIAFDPSLPMLVMTAVKTRLETILKPAAIFALVRSRTTILKPAVLTEAASLLREHYEDTLSVPKLFPDRNAVNAVSAGVATGSGTSRGKRKAKRRKYDDDDEYVDDDDDSEFVEEESGVVEMSEPTPEELRLMMLTQARQALKRTNVPDNHPKSTWESVFSSMSNSLGRGELFDPSTTVSVQTPAVPSLTPIIRPPGVVLARDILTAVSDDTSKKMSARMHQHLKVILATNKTIV